MSTVVARRGLNCTSLAGHLAQSSPCIAVTSPAAAAGIRKAASLALVGSPKASATALASVDMSYRRLIHSSQRRTSTIAETPETMLSPPSMEGSRAPLSVLPFIMILRSLATTTVSSSPFLLNPSMTIMSALAHSKNPLLSPDWNPLLRYFLKQTFYAQFCAGENQAEVRRSIAGLKNIGFTGVILGYAKEAVLTDAQAAALQGEKPYEETAEVIRDEINPWAQGTLETVSFAQPGDFVSLKFTGAGHLALYQLQHRLPCSPHLASCIDSICQLAHSRGVRLLFDAEQDALQDGIDEWTMHYAAKYNQDPNNTVIHGTYQAYKKCMPEVLSKHLKMAQEGGFTLGVKLVRGAYLGSDPRHCLHDTKEDTDACYDSLAASTLTRQWVHGVQGSGVYPSTSLVLATHNAESVRRARAICDAGAARSPIAFAQLQGMADEISCELVEAGTQQRASPAAAALPTYKYMVWGSTKECMKYLLRRAHENKDAVQRTRSSRDAMFGELVRRCKAAVGLAA